MKGVTSAEVLARVENLRKNLELIRLAMGRPAPAKPTLRVNNAQPAEVYSQARNLEQLAFGFAFEKIRRYQSPSPLLYGTVKPGDVLAIFDNALESILAVGASMGIEPNTAETHQGGEADPSDVFNAAVAAGNELNNLIKRKTTPASVFQTVSTAVYIAASLHRSVTQEVVIPEQPPLEKNKSSSQVFARMQRCFELVAEIAKHRNIQTLELDIAPEQLPNISPDDVQDLAFLLVEELHIIHQNTPGASETAQVFTSGEKLPAHVYQRVGLLELILSDLAAYDRDHLAKSATRK